MSSSETAKNGLRYSTTALLLGRVAQFAGQFVCLAILARWGTARGAGDYVLAIAICTPAVMFANLQLHIDLAVERERARFGDYLRLRLLAVAAALGLVCSGSILITGNPAWVATILSIALLKGVEAISDLFGALQLSHSRGSLYGRSLVLRGGIQIITVFVIYTSTGDLPLSVLSTACGWLLVVLLHDLPASRQLRAFDVPSQKSGSANAEDGWRSRIGEIGLRTMPLGLSSLVGSLELSAPRLAAAAFLGMQETGLIAMVISMTLGGQLLNGAAVQTAFPRLASAWSLGDPPGYRRLRRRLVAIVGLFGGVQLTLLLLVGASIFEACFLTATPNLPWMLGLASLSSTLVGAAAVYSNSLRSRGHYALCLKLHGVSLALTTLSVSACAEIGGLLGVVAGMSLAGLLSLLLFSLADEAHLGREERAAGNRTPRMLAPSKAA